MTENYQILVSDALAEAGLQPLREEANMDVHVKTGLTLEELIAEIPNYDALMVRSATKVTAEVIEAGKRLRVVARAGVGVDNIDIPAATQAGIIVVNAPTGNTVAAAEHTTAMLMALARNIPQADAHVRSGLWKRSQFVGVEVRGKVLGSVGLGRVAQEVARHAQGLGMTVIALDPYVTPEYAAQRNVRMVDLDTLLSESDFITFHIPLTDQTRNMLNKERIAQMKPGARVLNVSRGGVIDEDALLEAIESGHIAGAALDVFANEPLDDDSPLRQNSQVILTPHLGASTVEAQEQVAIDVAVQVIDVLNDRPARYAVNAPMIPPKDLDYLIPYIDLAERLGRFLKQVDGHGFGDVELTAHGKLAEFDLTHIKAAVIKGLLEDVVQVRINLVNAMLMAERRNMNLVERKTHQLEDRYGSMLTLSATTGEQRWTVRGAFLQNEPRIVALNDLWIEFPASGHMLLTSHVDCPGIIGRVGTIMGQGDVNISFMHVGRHGPRTSAIMALGTDELTPPEVLSKLDEISELKWRKVFTL
ncbi:MAG: phosphoglycerate dehydrogenase [Chloroflexota bacterium]